MGLNQKHFKAMGTYAHIVIIGGDESLLAEAVQMVTNLENKWSRFLPNSEITAINLAGGMPVVVSEETTELIRRSQLAFEHTGGVFNSLMGDVITDLGYGQQFGLPGMQCVTLPEGTSFDPGGIGKGFAADLVVEMLMQSGAEGALCNLGGDLRVEGTGPDEGRWNIAVNDEIAKGHKLVLSLASGAVATSTCKRRQWTVENQNHHHLIDPKTRASATNAADLVTVVAAEAWQAEFLATALAITDETDLGDAAALVTRNNQTRRLGPIERYIR